MSIVSSLSALQTAKADIAAAIARKGIAVPAGDGFADYAAHIMAIAPDPLLVTAAEYIAQARPSEWPDHTLVSLTGQEVCYLTYDYVHMAALVPRHMSVIVTCTGNYTVSRGHIGTSGFVADETFTAASGAAVSLTGAQTGTADYVCYKIDGTAITAITLQNIALADGALLPSYDQNVVEVFARLPSVTSVVGLRANTIVLETLKDCISVTTLANAWAYNTSLQSLDLSGWDTSAVTTLANAWDSCSSLQSLDLSGWNTSAVTTLLNAWSYCSSLQSLDLSGWDTSAVTTLASAWGTCRSLFALVAPTHIRVSHSLSASTAYSVTTLVAWIEALDSLLLQPAQTLTLGETNLAKLSSAQKAVATGKNWTLA